MRTVRDTTRAAADGFVLIGVLMFVLVLTILGLSLFSLSGYEAQFMQGSLDQQRAFYLASSGLERAKWVLLRTDSLPRVKEMLPLDGVSYAVAVQEKTPGPDLDSLGPVNWSKPITVRALAVVNGRRQLLEARVRGSKPVDLYKRLFTLTGDITIPNPDVTNPLRIQQLQLQGEVWQNTTNGLWKAAPAGWTLHNPAGGVPAPDLSDPWWATRMSMATEVTHNPLGVYPLGTPGVTTYYKSLNDQSPNDIVNNRWSFSALGGPYTPLQFAISGTVVWLFDHGFRLDPEGHVFGLSPGATLVLVARPSLSGAEAGNGIEMLGSLQTDNVNLILVSNGGVKIEHTSDPGEVSVGYLSVFAAALKLRGPNDVSNFLSLSHPINAPQDLANGLIDQLIAQHALPNSDTGLAASLKPVAGTWREIKDSSGDPF